MFHIRCSPVNSVLLFMYMYCIVMYWKNVVLGLMEVFGCSTLFGR